MSNGGFNLLELLIAMFMAVLLTTGALEIYLSLKKNSLIHQAQLQSDVEIRLAIWRVNAWIRLAGYQGCIHKDRSVNRKEAIRGYSANNIPSFYGISAKPDTDVLVIGECFYYQHHWQFLHQAIYIGKTGRKDKNGKNIYALYDKKIPGKSEELAGLISSLNILYGIKNPTLQEVGAYKNSTDNPDWSSVISVEYHLNHWANAYATLREFI